jgi:hypothetical protein
MISSLDRHWPRCTRRSTAVGDSIETAAPLYAASPPLTFDICQFFDEPRHTFHICASLSPPAEQARQRAHSPRQRP